MGVGYAPFVFLFGVLMGTGSSITTKVLYGLSSVGSSGELQYFEKPLLMTALMFAAMMLALPLHLAKGWHDDRQAKQRGEEPAEGTNWRTVFLFLIPAGFDLLATALSTAGLMFTTVSMFQLIRCSVMIFVGLMKALVLRQPLKSYMWLGLGINTFAMMLVSWVSFMPEHTEQQPGPWRDPRIGIVLILLSSLVQASQYVFEEKLMVEDSAEPLLIVGMEGLWGLIIMVSIVFPWAALLPGTDEGGCLENVADSWIMIQNSRLIQALLIVFLAMIFFFNIFAIYVTYLLNSVWHAILENFRPGAVWAADLALYYLLTRKQFGEAWTHPGSEVQLLGMAIMIFGTAVYNASIRLPFFLYAADTGLPSETAGEEVSFTSDAIASSPLISKSARDARRLSGLHGGPHLDRDESPDSDEESGVHMRLNATKAADRAVKEAAAVTHPLLGSNARRGSESNSASSSPRVQLNGAPLPTDGADSAKKMAADRKKRQAAAAASISGGGAGSGSAGSSPAHYGSNLTVGNSTGKK